MKMSKDFIDGVYRTALIINPFVVMFLVYLLWNNPYNKCSRMYTAPEDIMVCTFILDKK